MSPSRSGRSVVCTSEHRRGGHDRGQAEPGDGGGAACAGHDRPGRRWRGATGAPAADAVDTDTQTTGDGHTCALTRAVRVVTGAQPLRPTRVPSGVYTAITAATGRRARDANWDGALLGDVPAVPREARSGGQRANRRRRRRRLRAEPDREGWGCLSDRKGARTRVPAGLYKQVIVGDGYACALTLAGRIRCWNLYSGPTGMTQGVRRARSRRSAATSGPRTR